MARRHILGIASAAALVAIAGCTATADSGDDANGDGKITVVYRITGANGAKAADLTFTTSAEGSISQANGRQLPWHKSFTFKDAALNFYSVSAQNKGSGAVTCTVTVDGKVVAKNTARGQYAIASCDKSSGL